MSLQKGAPTNVDAEPDNPSLLARLTAKARRHVERWGRRYVEMRVDALER
jgi:hypothetical protein